MADVYADVRQALGDLDQDLQDGTKSGSRKLDRIFGDMVVEWNKLKQECKSNPEEFKREWKEYQDSINQAVWNNPEAQKILHGASIVDADENHIGTTQPDTTHLKGMVAGYHDDGHGKITNLRLKDGTTFSWDDTNKCYARTAADGKFAEAVSELKVGADGTVSYQSSGFAYDNGFGSMATTYLGAKHNIIAPDGTKKSWQIDNVHCLEGTPAEYATCMLDIEDPSGNQPTMQLTDTGKGYWKSSDGKMYWVDFANGLRIIETEDQSNPVPGSKRNYPG